MSGYIIHYGIKGQQHGKRRFQNEDGSLTEAGRLRYGQGHRVQPKIGREVPQRGESAKGVAEANEQLEKAAGEYIRKREMRKTKDAVLDKKDDFTGNHINKAKRSVTNVINSLGDMASLGAAVTNYGAQKVKQKIKMKHLDAPFKSLLNK